MRVTCLLRKYATATEAASDRVARRKPFSACSIRIDGNLDEIAIQILTIVRHHLSEGT